ncbi:UNVERIFIED_ORG: hypothetical protein J2Y81_007389 [Paraburkholderia sediminicola]|nr:hypothetical protein [Paraburkholderia sediminicola]
MATHHVGRLGVEGDELRTKSGAFDANPCTPVTAFTFNHAGQPRYDAGTVSSDFSQIAAGNGDYRDDRRADVAGVFLGHDEKHRVAVAGCRHAANPQRYAERSNPPAMRTAQCREQMRGDDQHDTHTD